MRYGFFELIEEAHDHGRDMVGLWGRDKSLSEFLKQYNLSGAYAAAKNNKGLPAAAKSLRDQGYTIREIAFMLGYKHPGSVSHLLSKKTHPLNPSICQRAQRTT